MWHVLLVSGVNDKKKWKLVPQLTRKKVCWVSRPKDWYIWHCGQMEVYRKSSYDGDEKFNASWIIIVTFQIKESLNLFFSFFKCKTCKIKKNENSIKTNSVVFFFVFFLLTFQEIVVKKLKKLGGSKLSLINTNSALAFFRHSRFIRFLIPS